MGILEDMQRQRQQEEAAAKLSIAKNKSANLSNAATTATEKAQNSGGLAGFLGGLWNGVTEGATSLGKMAYTGANEIGALLGIDAQNKERESNISDLKTKQNEIAQKYGYKDYSSAINDNNASSDFWNEVKNASENTSDKLTDSAKSYKNNDNTQFIQNKTQSEVGTDAIRAENFLADVMTAGKGSVALNTAINAGQGALSGFADSIEKNGGIDWGEAGKSALIGAASGGAGSLAGGKIASMNTGSSTGLGKALTGMMSQGAVSGAAAGATGAGLSSALNGGGLSDVLGASMQGAQSGALAGGLTSGAMGLANKTLGSLKNTNKMTDTPNTDNLEIADIKSTSKKSKLANALRNTGEDMMSAQTNTTRAERRKLGIDNAGQAVDAVRKRTGMSNINDQYEFSKNITGSGNDSIMDTIQNVRMSRNAKGEPITISSDDLSSAIDDAIGSGWKKSVMGEDQAKFKQNLMEDLSNGDAIQASNWLKEQAQIERGVAGMKNENSAKAKSRSDMYTKLANTIDDIAYAQVPESNIKSMYQDTIDEFRMRAKESAQSGNKQYETAYNKLADEMTAIPESDRTIANYRSFKKDFVKSSQVAKISAGAQSGSLEAGLNNKNVISKIANNILKEPTDRVLAKAGGMMSDAANYIDNGGTGASGILKTAGNVATAPIKAVSKAGSALNTIAPNDVMKNVENAISKQSARGIGVQAGQYAKDKLDASNAANMADVANSEYEKASSDYETALRQSQSYNSSNALTQAQDQLTNISNAMQSALSAGDFTSYATLAELYDTAYGLYEKQAAMSGSTNSGNSISDLNSTAQSNVLKLQSAGNAIDELENLFNNAGGGQGIVGGSIANFLGGLGMNSDVSTYNALSEGLINQIGAAIGKTDSLNTEGEVNRALSLIPKITDDSQTAINKLNELRSMLGDQKETYNNLYGINLQ